jgi:hypothetical protein
LHGFKGCKGPCEVGRARLVLFSDQRACPCRRT